MRAPIIASLVFALSCSPGEPSAVDVSALPAEGELVEPPFEVRGNAEGLLLVWFDEDGLHTAQSRDEIPEAHRAMVRVDDLGVSGEERLDPELVYVADLTTPGAQGAFPVRRFARARFDEAVDAAVQPEVVAAPAAVAQRPADPSAPPGAAAQPTAQDPSADVVIYGASWCSACRSAAAFLRQRDVPFVERDVEREPGARQAMMRAAQAAGVQTRGIPVIDFRGRIIAGFNQRALEQAIAEGRQAI